VPAAITIGIDPEFEFGPLAVSWHGLMIAVGIVLGAWLASHYARERDLDPEFVAAAVVVIALAGIVGARLFYLAVNDPAALARPGDWIASRGYAFYGALIAGPLALAVWLRHRRLTVRYLDALAAGFPLGLAVGRIGDVINGEHYGGPTDLPWGFRYTHPDAEVPGSELAYHSGGFYELLLGLALLAILWPLRDRFRRPLSLLWTTVALYSAGRFVMFFWRDDAEPVALGLDQAQFTSLALIAVSLAGLWVSLHPALLRWWLRPARTS
jgi:phosphatidylglycerol---prolipoprotein diacylglyceryl transferase